MASTTRVEKLQYKEILTPEWREAKVVPKENDTVLKFILDISSRILASGLLIVVYGWCFSEKGLAVWQIEVKKLGYFVMLVPFTWRYIWLRAQSSK